MRDDFDELDDDQLYEDYEAYKAMIEAGVPQKEALKKTGLTAQIVKDLEEELGEEDDEFKSEFKEVWGQDDDDFDEDSWKEEDLEEDWDSSNDFDDFDDSDRDF